MVRLVQLAERLGYHSAWGIDFMTPLDDPAPPRRAWPEWYEILVTLAFLAGHTNRIKMGTAALQVPLRDPFTLARQAASIDVLSDGRLLLGVGLGFRRIEFTRMRPRDSKLNCGRLFDEYLEAMHRFFTEDAVSIEGKHYACDQLCLIPKPLQHPFPVYMSGVTDEVFARIAKWSTGWLLARVHYQTEQLGQRMEQLQKALEEAGRHLGEIDFVITIGLSLGRTREEALNRFYDSVLPARMDGLAAEQGMSERASQDVNQVLTYNLIGTPDDVTEQIYEIQKKKITHCVLYYNPVRNIQEMSEQIQWFGEFVLPRFIT